MLRRIAITVVALYAVGFVVFVTTLPKAAHDRQQAQGIVALTGGDTRLDVAVSLFENGVGQRLLISGVHPQTTKGELKKLTRGGSRFDCCADLGYAAADTRGNAQETAAWARFHDYHKLLLVTARYHMPRSLTEFHAVMPHATIVPYPVEPESIHLDGWWHDLRALRVLNFEYIKFLAVTVLTATGLEPSGLDRNSHRGNSRTAS